MKNGNYKKCFFFVLELYSWNPFKPENWEPFSKRNPKQCYGQDQYVPRTLISWIPISEICDFLAFFEKDFLNLDPRLGFPSITSEGLIPMSFISGLLSARAVSAFWTIFIWWIREEDFPGNLPPFSRSDKYYVEFKVKSVPDDLISKIGVNRS